ncbi:diguanylate cyclase [Clostridium sp. AM58-1XD]|uniref:GGDEF/HDGYP domain-containing response regulator n=1 Tax=Clostridium sp. AM58-1XD TaxID=2292307 RepID=UPI000E4FD337|nr:diguanylate cyclase [Clostridium sp. AM58-1XD]RGZ00426.1 diguanylate cyclase [Clostridium sp. AM58-1XD]
MEQKYQILIVDDAEINRSMLADMLTDQYSILEASNGVEAISILEKQHSKISLVLLDIMMPEMNGFEVLSIMGKSEWLGSVPVIMISAETSSSYIDRAYDLGATDFISRPFDEKTVQRRVKNTIMLYAKQKMLEGMVTEQILEKERNNFLMVEILSNIVEFRNGESGLHVLHIRTITELLLRHLVRMTDKYPLTASQIALIVNASALHDIGKISIPENILNKPGRLTPEEFEIMKTHSAIGAQILENAPYRQKEELVHIAHDICRWHHERYDGLGYPDGLKGEEIPIAAQVVALADVYDALTNERVYKPAYSHESAMRMILNGECGSFNPILRQCLIEVGPRIAEEMECSSPEQISADEISDISTQLLSSGKASSRTLALLEQERTKYQFFASMSKEIQYEYNKGTDLLTLSDWGAAQLGLTEVITHPLSNAELQKVVSFEDLNDLASRLKKAGPDNPIVHATYALNIQGEPRWYKAVARPLWVGEEHSVMTGAIGKFSDIHEERLQLEALKKRAEQDSLTKLHNHMSARELIENTLVRGRAGKCALILFDLDLFKNANDQYGHMFGDAVLKDVAERIVRNIRKEDIAARIGGDEFLIFTKYQSNVEAIVKRLFHAISGEYAGFEISLSMGVSICPKDGKNYEILFHRADQALYAAKKQGKRQYCFYNPAVKGTLSVLSPMESDLENSVDS